MRCLSLGSFAGLLMFLAVSSTTLHAQDAKLSAPENVQITGSTLSWDPVDDANGYNILFNSLDVTALILRPMHYLETVKGATSYELNNVGTYQVIAFDESTGRFSDTFFEHRVYFNPDSESVAQETQYQVTANSVITEVCENVGPGEKCQAVCPRAYEVATGGACSTSDIVEADATATDISYSCTVPLFSGFVTAQVYCLNTAYFQRSFYPNSLGYR